MKTFATLNKVNKALTMPNLDEQCNSNILILFRNGIAQCNITLIIIVVVLSAFDLIYSKFSERCSSPCLGIVTSPPAFIKKLKESQNHPADFSEGSIPTVYSEPPLHPLQFWIQIEITFQFGIIFSFKAYQVLGRGSTTCRQQVSRQTLRLFNYQRGDTEYTDYKKVINFLVKIM